MAEEVSSTNADWCGHIECQGLTACIQPRYAPSSINAARRAAGITTVGDFVDIGAALERCAAALEKLAEYMAVMEQRWDAEDERAAWDRYIEGKGPKPR